MVWATFAALAIGQTQAVLTVSFDRDFNGVGPRGNVIQAIPVDKPELVPGKFGRALKTGSGTGFVDYPTKGILNPHGGTVEMWVCPLDWKPDDQKFHTFFDARGQGALYLYKYLVGTDLLMLTCDNVLGPYASSAAKLDRWKPGQWHHIAGTWSARGVQTYVDGKPAGTGPVEGSLPRGFGPTFRLGDQPWQFPRSTASLVDEVRIYDRALVPAHLAAHFAGNYRFSVPLSPDAVRLVCAVDPRTFSVEVRFDTGGADVDDARVALELAVLPEGRDFAPGTESLKISAGQASRTLSLPSREPGNYRVAARIVLDGKRALDVSRPLVIPAAPWLGNRLGREGKVLPPWTPLEVHNAGGPEATVISCWNRSYEFQRAALPTQIVSRGEALLARPVVLRVWRGGGESIWQGPAARLTGSSALRATLAAGAPSSEGAGGFQLRAVAEYDGLVLFEISPASPAGREAERLSLEIPVRAARAMYYHRYSANWASLAGEVPARPGVANSTSFVPFAWLGDNDRGLFWFCESDQMWPNAQGNDAIQIVRADGEVSLRLNLLAKGQKLPADWRFVFGLQATPVKPIPKDWRKWRMSPGRKANLEIVWPQPHDKTSLSQFGYPEAADPQAFTEHIRGLHGKGLKAIPYLCLTYVTGATPEWQFYRRIWDMGSADPSVPEAGWSHTFHLVSPVGRGYADFMMWKTHEFLTRYGIDGVYHDQTSPYVAAAVEAGVGYLRDGQPQPAYPILGYRGLYRRNYAVVKSLPRETFTMAHMSSKVTIPILAYDDSYLDGEHFRDQVKDSYLDVLPLDTFRAEFMGRQWGLMPFFLPEFNARYAAEVEPTRGMMGLLMIHDVSVWPIWCNLNVVDRALEALDAFGYVEAEFIPYFDPAPPAASDMKDVYTSAYRRADGRALVVVANLSRENRAGQLRIDRTRLGLPDGRIFTWPEKQPLESAAGRLRLDVPRLGYRMLLVGRLPGEG
jgi:hypothetical protein